MTGWDYDDNPVPAPVPERHVMNPLEDMPRTRKIVYRIWAFLALVQIAVLAGFAAIDGVMPSWLIVCLAVYTALSAPIGYTAQRNV